MSRVSSAERQNWQVDNRIEDRDTDDDGIYESCQPESIGRGPSNRKPDLKLSERHEDHEQQVPGCGKRIEEDFGADVSGCLDGD